jgi:hypothetical protein
MYYFLDAIIKVMIVSMLVSISGSLVVAIYSLGTFPATVGLVVLIGGLVAFLLSIARISFSGHSVELLDSH